MIGRRLAGGQGDAGAVGFGEMDGLVLGVCAGTGKQRGGGKDKGGKGRGGDKGKSRGNGKGRG